MNAHVLFGGLGCWGEDRMDPKGDRADGVLMLFFALFSKVTKPSMKSYFNIMSMIDNKRLIV